MMFEINRKSSIVMVLAGTLALSACATDKTRTGSIKRNDTAVSELSVPQLNRAIETYGRQYERRPKSKQAGLNYADALRTAGRNEQALAVVQQMVIHHPQDNDVLAAYGKALASNGELQKALDVIGRAQHDDRPDWRLLSAQGAVLDQLDRPQEARVYYQKALQIVPDEPSVLSNIGMSYLLTNELPQAEQYLKQAVATRKADSRVRQNLALVVGLQGRFDEAERIAAAEMSPTDAKANVEYLRQMLSQQNAWNILKEEDKKAN